jgi:hypothetical protein
MTQKPEFDTVFASTFVGETIFVTTNVVQTNRVIIANDMQTETIPLCLEGVLMDLDDDYLYLGDGKEISNAVKKDFILQIEVKEDEDPYKTLLENIPGPMDDSEFN